jgi:hypothetical protein
MTNKNDEIERLVLQAVANDYEEFDMIVHDVTKLMHGVCEAPNVIQIENALMKSIVDRNVDAYQYSETIHQYVATQADVQNLRTLWFYITDQGKRRLRDIEDEN